MTNFTKKKLIIPGVKLDKNIILTESVRKKILSESVKKCREEWYWDDEYDKDYPCWDGKDPMSCELRKFIGEELDFRITYSNTIASLPTTTSGLFKTPCGLGSAGDLVENPFNESEKLRKKKNIKPIGWKRQEIIYILPISPNNSNIWVEVFRERKEIVTKLESLVGEKWLSGSDKDIQALVSFRFGNKDGCYVFYKKNATDSEIKKIVSVIRNQTSIPFGVSKQGETNVQYVEKADGESTQTISSKIINTTNPENGKKYIWNDVKKEFGSTGTLEDNLKLSSAWEEGWRPGDDVPSEYQTETYKKNNSNNDGDGEDVNNNIGNSDVNMMGDNSSSDQQQPKVDQITGISEAQFDGSIGDWFESNFKYPSDAESRGIEGTVDVSFTVDVDGNINNVSSDSNIDESLVQNAIDLVKKMPKWMPANKDGVNIESKVILPIEYFLGFE
jgi:TonB family protein